jgi:hypothetical protein
MKAMTPRELQAVERATLHLNAQAWGVSAGLVCGAAIFIATIVAMIRGGALPGRPLALVSQYLPGFSVSVIGAFVGFIYLFVIGYALGRLIGIVYNLVAGARRA